MRINSWNVGYSEAAGVARPSRTGENARTSQSTPSGAEDEARLTSGRMQVVALEAELSKMPETRQDKIEKLRRAVSDGTYQRDDHEIAAALFDDVAARSRLFR